MSETTCHFIGIGGIGMSALAKILLAKNCKVTGSDLARSDLTDFLSQKGAKIFIGHSEKNVAPGSLVVFSSDVLTKNPEYQAAVEMQCKLLHRSDLLLELMRGYKTLAVTGTHGKTTTTTLLVKVLTEACMDPSFAIGGIGLDCKTNAEHGQGEYFIAEADESDGSFLKYLPFGAIVTNIDLDHMNYYKTEENLENSFKQFFSNVASKEHLFYCGDDPRLLTIAQGISYGFKAHNDLRITEYRQLGWSSIFDLQFEGKQYDEVELALIGEHNALNALAVFGLSLKLGIDEQTIRKAFKSFQGISKRCERKAFTNGVLFLDDYGHHPTEIKATLKAIREATEEKRLIAVYQPHRYSRIKELLKNQKCFKNVFNDASELIVTDIYSAGETAIDGISHLNIMQELKGLNIPYRYVERKALASYLKEELAPHDVLVSFGAGDITHLASEILALCTLNQVKKLKVGLFFGGKSKEHEVSIRSARNVLQSMNLEFYEPHLFCISTGGVFQYGQDLLKEERIEHVAKTAFSAFVLDKIQECDVLFPILHGPFGEDGTIQGFFEMLGKPYVGCDYRASSVCMDKILTKNLMLLNGIATSPFVGFTHVEWKNERDVVLTNIQEHLQFPLFIKPAHLGSSIAVSKVMEADQLEFAIENAFLYDGKVLAENAIMGREIEFAVLGNEKIEAFPPGEVLTNGKIYTYEAKYLTDEIKTAVLADLREEMIEEGINLAKWAYLAAGCQGMARVDFFLDIHGKYWLNEINPIPGFTDISLYPKMCTAHGMKAEELIDRLIILALDKKRTQLKYE